MGPRATLKVRRIKLADNSVYKMACKKFKKAKKKHMKNIKRNALG